MFCPQCGANNDQQSLHCSQCGAALQQPPAVQPQAPQYPPPGGQPYYPPPQYNAGAPLITTSIPNYMTQAVLVTVFCCLPLGIAGIFRAREVNKRLAANDIPGALEASKSALSMCWWGFGSGLVITVLYAMAQLQK